MTSREPGGALLVGPSGTGKTWVQRRLVERHGFWAPLHVTTRVADAADFGTRHMELEEFMAACASGELTAPMLFGGSWHAWARDEFDRLCRGEGRPVTVCRPYEALLLHSIQPRLVPIWLAAPADVLAERRAGRGAQRNVDPVTATARGADDEEDDRYRPLFEHVVSSAGDAVDEILRLLERLARSESVFR